MMRTFTTTLMAAALGAMLMAPLPLGAQETPAAQQSAELSGFWLTTSWPEMTIKPGETQSVSLSLRNEKLPPQRATIEVSGVPESWAWSLKGGGRDVTAAIVSPDSTERLTLELTPPEDASTDGEHAIEVRARTAAETVTLPLVVRLSETEDAASGLSLEPELPALRGTARSTFSFKIKVKNEGAEDGLFNLTASVPAGFQTRFKKGYGSEEITGLPIAAGATETVTMEVIPSRGVAAGRYEAGFEVSGKGLSGTTQLSLDVTGEPQVAIVGPQERLSGEAVAGRESSFTFTLVNTGTAPATDLELSATPPSGWTVAFEPQDVAQIAPNSTGEVNVKITPSEQAIAGDYMVSVRASNDTVSESVQFRVTVRTSTMWGAAGLGVIAVAALVLGGAVMRYGRR
ncbi:NEW3 domain-containing protein [Brucella intermedia]|uniref:COG1470 family protein n=1 Tax=Brucella intermedia TaxID=94625 RepID=UPI002448A580|nr:NEW3 domain-containing protein [Brucella intermedia]WGG60789.1 NEW3 domain-containing protein [Brucella intermedia]